MNFGILKLGELGEVSFRMLKLDELGEMSYKCPIYQLSRYIEILWGCRILLILVAPKNLSRFIVFLPASKKPGGVALY